MALVVRRSRCLCVCGCVGGGGGGGGGLGGGWGGHGGGGGGGYITLILWNYITLVVASCVSRAVTDSELSG